MVQAAQTSEDDVGGIATVDVATLDPETFWAKYVAPRKPVLIRGHPTDLSWRASSLWTDEYLIKKAGSARVLVEVRGGPGEGYGRGVKRPMRFAQFVRRVAAGDTNLYLTAQQVSIAPDGHPQLMAEPLISLAGGAAGGPAGGGGGGGSGSGADFPAAPSLAGHLVPQSLNVWMGAAPEGSSSGLHHDFHDNLYVLLRGRKRFRLFPPAQAALMYTHGRAVRVHDNGRIVYEGQGAAERLAAAECALEAALEAELSDAAWEEEEEEGEGKGDDDFDMQEEEDGDDEEEEQDGEEGEEEEEEEEEEDEAQEAAEEEQEGGPRNLRDDFDAAEGPSPRPPHGKRGNNSSSGNGSNGSGSGSKGAKGGGSASKGQGRECKEEEEEEADLIVDNNTPPSFSRVPMGDPRVSDLQLAAAFPLFPGRSAAVEVVVEAGSMLYLPAGWFHEVTSYGTAGGTAAAAAEGSDDVSIGTAAGGGSGNGSGAKGPPGGGPVGHLAFNYWFHPPDNLDPSRRGFKSPYVSDFWPSFWRSRTAAGLIGGLDPGPGAQAAPGQAADAAAAGAERKEEEGMEDAGDMLLPNGTGPNHGSVAAGKTHGSERKRRKAGDIDAGAGQERQTANGVAEEGDAASGRRLRARRGEVGAAPK
ncbi:hypothetical protein Agub_g6296, partial [Astrephomene gubernaculifera]